MSTSSIVFVALVVLATTVPIAIFAWVAGNKRDKVRPNARSRDYAPACLPP
jgi:hypothetical protein